MCVLELILLSQRQTMNSFFSSHVKQSHKNKTARHSLTSSFQYEAAKASVENRTQTKVGQVAHTSHIRVRTYIHMCLILFFCSRMSFRHKEDCHSTPSAENNWGNVRSLRQAFSPS